MSPSLGEEELEEPEFKWGKKRGVGGKNKDVRFYESFTYDGVDYALYDCVYMYKRGEPEPYIGKLVKVWENADKSKKIKVHWFFRPSEISYHLKDAGVLENELFFASGDGMGLANINPLDAIAGKCNVICISTDSRNPQPSAEEVQMADYVFYRIFDVKTFTISDQMDDKVGGLEVKFIFNKRERVWILDVPLLEPNGKDEDRNVIAWKETPKLEGKDKVKMEENGNFLLENGDTSIKQEQVKQGTLLGECSTGVDVNSNEHRETEGTNIEKRNTQDAKNVECKVSGEKDKLKDLKSQVSEVGAEERLKSTRKSDILDDDTPVKRVKTDDAVSSLKDKDPSKIQSSAPVNDAHNLGSNAKSKSESVKNSDVKLAKNSSFSGENLSNKGTPKSGHADDALSLEKDAILTKESNALQTKVSQTNGSPSTEKYFVANKKDKEPSGNFLSASKGKPSTTNVAPNETPKSGLSKDLEGSGQDSKLVKGLNASMKRPLKTNGDMLKEKSNSRHDACQENNDIKSGKDSPHMEGGPSKKTKFDDHANTTKKLNEKTYADETKNSSMRVDSFDNKAKSRHDKRPLKEHHNENMGKLSKDNLPNSAPTTSEGNKGKVDGQRFEVTRRPIEKSNWIKLPWEQKLKSAHEQGRLVLLQNLDPDCTSGEVEDIIWHAFKEHCTAKMLQHTAISNPYSGQAFVIFKTREAAYRVVRKLDDGCLMLPNRRPLVACIGVIPNFTDKQTAFVGHLAIERARRPIQREMKEAVSTSHYSQNNTIEYEMAMGWRFLQSKSDEWWKELYKQQRVELQKLTAALRSQ